MGSPASTTFCNNGHIVYTISRHCIDDFTPVVCPYCDSTKLTTVFYWGDPDYPQSIPSTPIKEEVLIGFNVPVYDVSKIKLKEWHYTLMDVDYLVDTKTGQPLTFFIKGSVDRAYFVYSIKEKHGLKVNPDKIRYTYFRNIQPTEQEKKYCSYVVEMNNDPKDKTNWYRVTIYELYKDEK